MERIVYQDVIKEIEVPVERIVEKVVEVEVPVVQERIVEKIKEVEVPIYHEKIVEKIVGVESKQGCECITEYEFVDLWNKMLNLPTYNLKDKCLSTHKFVELIGDGLRSKQGQGYVIEGGHHNTVQYADGGHHNTVQYADGGHHNRVEYVDRGHNDNVNVSYVDRDRHDTRYGR